MVPADVLEVARRKTCWLRTVQVPALYCPRVRWSTTAAAWARREAVLLSCLGAAAAVALLAGPLGAPWLRVVGIFVATAGALARAVIAVRRARLESALERADSARRLRVAVAPVGEINPTVIGVDPAAQTILPGDVVPEYVARAADGVLQQAVAAALDGRGRWLVVVVGRSKVGKSRTMFEALRQVARTVDLQLVAPVNGGALLSLLNPGQGLKLLSASVVLWLDDLESFLNEGVTLQTLREWHADTPGRVVAATFGGKGSELIKGSRTGGLATMASEVLQHAREIPLDATTAGELSPLRVGLSAGDFSSIERHGLAAYLIAGPALERKLTTGRHAPGDDECPEGVAVVYAAIDWARCGRTDPISEQALRQLWPAYLRAGIDTTDEGFKAGLGWALRPVAGTIALLQRSGGYEAFDYVVQLVRDKPSAEPPREPSWSVAVQTATDAQAMSVAISAFEYLRFTDAVTAFARARESSSAEVNATAGYNLGVTLGRLGRSAEAVAVFDDVVDRFGDDPALREQVARALVSKGVRLGELGRSAETIAVYDEVVDRFGDDPAPALRERVARALAGKGLRLAQLDRSAEAIAVYDEVVDRFGDDPAPPLREQVARALVAKGQRLGQLGRSAEAIAAFDEVVVRFGDDPAPPLREQVARALVSEGLRLAQLDRSAEAIAVFDEVVVRFGDDPAPPLRDQVALALAGKGVALEQLDRSAEAIAVYDDVVHRLGDDPAPALREQVASTLADKGVALRHLDRSEEAIAVYDEVVVRFGDDPAPALHEQVARTLVNKGVALERLDRSAEAIAVFDDVVNRFGNDPAPGLHEQVALALVGKGVGLALLDRSAAAIAVLDDVVNRFGDDPTPALRDTVAQAVSMRRKVQDRDS
jgi:tetratricopeptide (TPR) repeat protein